MLSGSRASGISAPRTGAAVGGGAGGLGSLAEQFDPTKYCIPGEITVHEVNDMKRAFDMIDEDGSGFIDAEELQGAAVALGIPMEENIAVLLGTDKIPFDEFFKRMTAKLNPQDTADDILNIFELFDNDATGSISFENLQNIARIIGAKEGPKEIQEMLSTLDTDGDGELDPIDFYTCLVSGMRLRLEEGDRLRKSEADDLATAVRGYSSGSGTVGAGAGGTVSGSMRR
jgi:Ca2+-binding EF-hand superfamily protein